MQAIRRAMFVGMACCLVLGLGCTQKKGVTSEGGAGAQNVGGIYVELSRESVDVEAGGSDTVSVMITVFDNSFVGIEGIQVRCQRTNFDDVEFGGYLRRI